MADIQIPFFKEFFKKSTPTVNSKGQVDPGHSWATKILTSLPQAPNIPKTLENAPRLSLKRGKNPIANFFKGVVEDVADTPRRALYQAAAGTEEAMQGKLTPQRAIGRAAGIAELPLTFLGGTGLIKATGKAILKPTLKVALKEGAKVGAGWGALSGFLQGVNQNMDAPSVSAQLGRSIPHTALGAGFGALFGGGTSALANSPKALVMSIINKLRPNATKKEVEKIADKYLRDKAGRFIKASKKDQPTYLGSENVDNLPLAPGQWPTKTTPRINQEIDEYLKSRIPQPGLSTRYVDEAGRPLSEEQLNALRAQGARPENIPVEQTAGQSLAARPEAIPNQTTGSQVLPYDSTVPQQVPRSQQELNVDRLNLTPEGRANIQQIEKQNAEKVKQVLSNKDIIDIAKRSGIDTKTHSIDDTANRIAEQLNTRNALVSLENQFQTLQKSGGDPGQLEALTKQIAEISKAARTQGTDVARQLQARRIIANELDTPMQKVFKLLDNAGINPDVYTKRAATVDFNNPQEVTNFFRKLVPPKAREWIDEIRYNSMLSSPLTHITNVTSNLLGSGFVAPIEKTITGTLDFIGSKVLGKQQTRFAGEGAAYLGGYLGNVKKAFSNFADAITDKKSITNLDYDRIPLGTTGVTKGVERTLTFPSKLLEATDQFFSAMVEGGEESALKFKGRRGVSTNNLTGAAEEAAKYRLFRQGLKSPNQGAVLNGIDDITSKILALKNSKVGWVKTIADFTLPFVQTPMNVLKQGVEYSPLGLTTIPGARNKTEQLSKALIGIGSATAAASLLGSGRITWAEPTDPNKKAAFREAGMQPYSVKIGDKWVSFSKLPPNLSFNLALIAGLDDLRKNNQLSQDIVDNTLKAVAKYGSFLSDQSYFKSIGDLVSLSKGDKEAYSRLISNYPQQLVPFRALGGWLARLSDQYQRQIPTDASFIDKQVQQLMLNIPGLSQQLPARLGLEGQPIESQNRLLNAFSPLKVTQESPQGAQTFSDLEALTQGRRQAKEEAATRQTEVEQIFNQIQSVPPEQRRQLFQQLVEQGKITEDNADDFIKLAEGQAKPLSAVEKSLKTMPVRKKAEFIINKIKALKTPQDKRNYLVDLEEKGLISDQVIAEIENQLGE